MNNKGLVLFMGNTGAGKSTAVSFFLDTELEFFTNKIGDQVLRRKEEQKEEQAIPKIGQSFGTSETIYTQGYTLPNSEIMLADCPGFNDTRGGDYELCTNLSIDQAVLQANQVHSIVLLIPASAFLVDRANNIIELIQVVKERFPGAFEKGNSHKSSTPPIYLLITKANQIQQNTVEGLKKGTRFQECLKEMSQNLSDLEKRGLSTGDFEYDACLARKTIWEALVAMHKNKQIDILNIKNKAQKRTLRNKYSKPDQLTAKKISYKSAMQTEEIQKKFGDCIELSAHTWSHLILEKYLTIIPQDIQQAENSISLKKTKLLKVQDELSIRAKKITDCINSKRDLKEMIQALRGDPSSLSPTLRAELQAKVVAASEAVLQHERDELKKIKANIKDTDSQSEKMANKIEEIKKEISNFEKTVKQTEEEISKLKEGSTKEVLYQTKQYQPDDKITVSSYSSKEYTKEKEKAFSKVKEMDFSNLKELETKTVIAKEYKGKWEELAIIDKKYKLCPTDTVSKDEFERTGSSGEYLAKYKGIGFTWDLGKKAMVDGKKMAYSYTLHWVNDAKKLPWLKISHTIPNHEINSATIINKSAEITLYQEKISRDSIELWGNGSLIPGLDRELSSLKHHLEQLNKQKKDVQDKIAVLEKAKTLKQMGELLSQKEKELADKKKEIATLRDLSEIQTNIDNLEKELALRQKELQKLLKKKRNYALIIKTQKQTTLLLRRLTETASTLGKDQSNDTYMQSAGRLKSTCQEFNNLYDREITQLKDKVNADLGLSG